MKNILSFDIEEHFQVSGLEAAVKREDWERHSSRVENNTRKVLDILSRHNVRATFFVLGWIGRKFPKLIKDIFALGHEIASHGFDHQLVYRMTADQFKGDVLISLEILQNITGEKIIGFRAPSFSLAADDLVKFQALAELGIKYDSSLFPMKHFRYADAAGVPTYPHEIRIGSQTILREFPMTVVGFLGRRIPAGGGGYFRLYPDFFIRRNFLKVNSENRPVVIYLHPWEFDPDQPRIKGAGIGNTFRHYHNLHKTAGKLEKSLKEFKFGPFRDHLAI